MERDTIRLALQVLIGLIILVLMGLALSVLL